MSDRLARIRSLTGMLVLLAARVVQASQGEAQSADDAAALANAAQNPLASVIGVPTRVELEFQRG